MHQHAKHILVPQRTDTWISYRIITERIIKYVVANSQHSLVYTQAHSLDRYNEQWYWCAERFLEFARFVYMYIIDNIYWYNLFISIYLDYLVIKTPASFVIIIIFNIIINIR